MTPDEIMDIIVKKSMKSSELELEKIYKELVVFGTAYAILDPEKGLISQNPDVV